MTSGPPSAGIGSGRQPALPAASALTTARARALLPSASSAVVTLEKEGAAPRRPLRYRWAAATALLTVETVVGTAVERGSVRQAQAPSELRLRLSLRVAAEDDGAATLHVEVLGAAESESDRDRANAAADSGAAAVQAIVAAHSSLRLDARGIPLASWTPLQRRGQQPPAADASEALQIWASVRDAVADAFVPLPAEPVGQGARWRSLERSSRGGAPMLRSAEHELSLDGSGLARITSIHREVAIAGPARDPALPPEVALTVLSGVGRGRRVLHRAVDGWLPTGAEGELAADLVLELSGPVGSADRAEVQLTQLWSLRPTVDASVDAGASTR